VALSRLLLGWGAVVLWLLLWDWIERQLGFAKSNGQPFRLRMQLVEGALLTMFGALWFASLGSGAWWLVFGLVAALREWPPSTTPVLAALRVARTIAAGGLLAWRLGPA
jgi:hypothetical protein